MTSRPHVAYRYAVIRAVPRADREEFLNIGVVLYCQSAGFLGARFDGDLERLRVLGLGDDDLDGVLASIAAIEAMCAGSDQARAVAGRSQAFRFGHITAPRSTVVRAGPSHGGVTADPQASLDELYAALVARAR